MRYLFYILTFTSIVGFAQQYGDKEIYLVDSLEIDNISKSDLDLIDSCIKVYKTSDLDTVKFNAINTIVETSWDDKVWAKYNLWLLIKITTHQKIELAYKQTLSEKFLVHHRFWSEFRFLASEPDSYTYANTRLRYKIELKYTPLKKVSLKAFDELFINAGNTIVNNVFDQNRIGSSIQFMPLDHLGFEIGYFNLFQQQKSGIDFYNRDIIKFTIHHTITVKKNKA